MNKKWQKRRKRLYEIIEVGSYYDSASKFYDYFSIFAISINLIISVLCTFEEAKASFGQTMLVIEQVTVAFFALDYILRVFTAKFIYPEEKEGKAIRKYVFSFTGIIDLLSFLPYYLPIFFPAGTVAFRMIRIVRILRLFRINAYHDSLSVITEVISSKRQQLMSSVFIILVLMIASSLCMYSLEHEAQPEVFTNAFSGIWWAASTLLTVGYGDIYPITTLGKIFGIIITFLGVGMVAIPTGIISAGFVEQYSRLKRISEYAVEENIGFIKIHLNAKDAWVGKTVQELSLPDGALVAMIRRDKENVVPRGDVALQADDIVILGAEAVKDDKHIELKEVVLLEHNPWNDQYIRDLDISRQTIIVMVRRNGTMLVPKGSLMLKEGDHVVLYTQERLLDANVIQV